MAMGPRTPINAERAFRRGWDDAADGVDTPIPATPKATFTNYYVAGRCVYQLGMDKNVGYRAAIELLGVLTTPMHEKTIYHNLSMAMVPRDKMTPAETPQPEPAVTTTAGRMLIDCDVCIVRVSGGSTTYAEPLIEVMPIQHGATPNPQPLGTASISGVARIKALREACNWALAKEVERQMLLNAQADEVDPGISIGRATQMLPKQV